jgi:hypothetical protein
LANRKIQVADLVRDQQHSLDDWRQIEETHLVSELRELLYRRANPKAGLAGAHSSVGSILAHNRD